MYISDLRFTNEFIALKDENWICIRLIRDKIDINIERIKGTGSETHSSENGIDYDKFICDHVII